MLTASSGRAILPGQATVQLLLLGLSFMAPLWALAEGKEAARAALWVDALRGEPVTADDMIADLKQARVIYPGRWPSPSWWSRAGFR